ncbi:MAG: hypothetical protein KI786_07605, partial [Mameliella sp.]|nr:hypothetical protein [Phaeodactylibacter sp.]
VVNVKAHPFCLQFSKKEKEKKMTKSREIECSCLRIPDKIIDKYLRFKAKLILRLVAIATRAKNS